MRCRRKLAFDTVEQAEATQRAVALVRGQHRTPSRLYECSHCGKLHFTSRPEGALDSHVTASTVAAVTIISAPAVETAPVTPPAPPPPVDPAEPRYDLWGIHPNGTASKFRGRLERVVSKAEDWAEYGFTDLELEPVNEEARRRLEELAAKLPPRAREVMRDLLGIRSVQVVPVERPEVEREQ